MRIAGKRKAKRIKEDPKAAIVKAFDKHLAATPTRQKAILLTAIDCGSSPTTVWRIVNGI